LKARYEKVVESYKELIEKELDPKMKENLNKIIEKFQLRDGYYIKLLEYIQNEIDQWNADDWNSILVADSEESPFEQEDVQSDGYKDIKNEMSLENH